MRKPHNTIQLKDNEFHEITASTARLSDPLEEETELLRTTVKSHNAPLPLPPPTGTGLYSRPLTQREAEMLLKIARIEHHGVDTTYVNTCGITDRNTARVLYPRTQCIVTRLPAKMTYINKRGNIVRTDTAIMNVHLFFVWEKKGGWKPIKAMLEEIL